MTGAFTVRGADTLDRTMHDAADELGDLHMALGKGGDVVVAAARQRAPHRTGALAASIRVQSVDATGVRMGSTAPYAGVIHWGWPARAIRAQPFLSDAAQATERQWVEFVEQSVLDAVDGVKGA